MGEIIELNEYAIYKGDNFLVMGTAQECADFMGWRRTTVDWYQTPSYLKRVAERKTATNYIKVIKLEDEE